MQEILDIQKPNLASLSGGEIQPPRHFAMAPAVLPRLLVRSILVPFDFSKTSVEILRGIVPFAKSTGASIHLLHVIEPSLSSDGSRGGLDDQLAEVSESMLKIWAGRIVRGEARTFASTRIGGLVDEIIGRAESIRADLIVAGADGYNSPRAITLRGAVERICRFAPCPTLIIPESCVGSFVRGFDGFPASNWKRILMPIDFSPASSLALKYAAAITIENRAEFTAVHSARNWAGLPTHDRSLLSMREARRQQVQQWIRGELNFQLHCKVTVRLGGSSLASILSEANQERSDLVVLPTRAGQWLQRFRMGSVTEGVLRHSPCPILSIQENIQSHED